MFGVLVLGKGGDIFEVFGVLVIDVFVEWTVGDMYLVWYLSGFGFEVILLLLYQLFIEMEDWMVQFEEIYYGIVVLKVVHLLYGCGQEGLGFEGLLQQCLELGDHMFLFCFGQFRFFFWWYFVIFQNCNQFFKQCWVGQQVCVGFQFKQVDFVFCFVVFVVVFYVVGFEG